MIPFRQHLTVITRRFIGNLYKIVCSFCPEPTYDLIPLASVVLTQFT